MIALSGVYDFLSCSKPAKKCAPFMLYLKDKDVRFHFSTFRLTHAIIITTVTNESPQQQLYLWQRTWIRETSTATIVP